MEVGPSQKQFRDVIVPEAITVQELANRMAERGADLVKALFKMGMVVTLTQTIDQDTAELLVTEFGHRIKRVSEADVDIDTSADVDAAESLPEFKLFRWRAYGVATNASLQNGSWHLEFYDPVVRGEMTNAWPVFQTAVRVYSSVRVDVNGDEAILAK